MSMKNAPIEKVKSAAASHELPDHVTVSEFAKTCGCHRTEIYNAIADGRITATLVGKEQKVMINAVLNAGFTTRPYRNSVEAAA